MSRYESFTEERELNKHFPVGDKKTGGFPTHLDKQGRLHCDPGSGHAIVVAMTGYGKTYGISLPTIMRCIEAKESFVVIDPKKDALTNTYNAVPDDYQKYVIDFCDAINSPDQWNPTELPRTQLNSEDISEQDLGNENLNAFADGLPDDGEDKFWPNSSSELITGLTESLIEKCDDPEEVHMGSVSKMLRDGNERLGTSIVLKSFYDSLPDDSLAKQHLSTFVNAPQDTRNSIYSVSSTALSKFSTSKGLMQLISRDTIDIAHLDNSKRPLAIYICLPDENTVYSKLAGCLVQQLSQRFIKLARTKPDGKLENRVNFILEELGSIGGAIPNLANLMVAGRSRNIRMMLVLQSLSQLDAIYNDSAEAIKNCVGITYCFSNNNYDTLKEFSEKCGYSDEGKLLITPSQLAAMEPLQCLVSLYNRYKYVHKFPYFHNLYNVEKYYPSYQDRRTSINDIKPIKYFDIKEYVKRIKEKERSEMMDKHHDFNPFAAHNPFSSAVEHNESVKTEDVLEMDFDKLMKELDEEIAKREKEEKEENE